MNIASRLFFTFVVFMAVFVLVVKIDSQKKDEPSKLGNIAAAGFLFSAIGAVISILFAIWTSS